MKNRKKTAMLVVVGIALGMACGDAVEMTGDAAVDAGELLVDAGRTLIDGGEAARDAGDAMRPDAAAQAPMVVTAECTEQIGMTWFAQAPAVINTGTVRSVRAILCDPEGSLPVEAAGLTCVSGGAWFDATTVRTNCGYGDPTGGGWRHRSIRFVIVE